MPPQGTSQTTSIIAYQNALANMGYSFRLNAVADRLEVYYKNEPPRAMSDAELRSIRAQMRARGFRSGEAVEDIVWHLGRMNTYHPIRGYLIRCGMTYDGGQHIAHLAGHFEDITQPYPMFRVWLRRWLIGAVAKAMRGGDVHNAMLVLDGPQGIGKSFFSSWLASEVPGYFVRGRIDPDQKDCWVRLMENFIWETAELGNTTRRADVDALKEFISSETVTIRRPYGKFDLRKPALASLIGTINNSAGFLADTTGNRRFLVSTIKTIDWNYAQVVPVSQVWGEAFVAFNRGEPWQPSPNELAQSEENNESFMIPDPLEGILTKYFRLDPNGSSWISTGEICERLLTMGYKAGSTKALSMELAATLQKAGIQKERRVVAGVRLHGYRGIAVKTAQSTSVP